MIKVKDGYAKLIGTTYQGSATQVLLSNGGDLEYSASSKASTLVQRNASQHIYATYFNSAISDEALTDIGSVYVRNTSDTFIRRVSKTQFYSILDDKFVTLDTTQSITGAKTFSTSVRFANNASIIQNQNNNSNYTTILKWYRNGTSRNTYDPSIGQHNTGGDGNGSICILPYPTETSPWGGTVGLFISKGVLKLDGKSVALAENYYTKTESDERYVNVTGDTMTGPLIVKAAITGTQLISTIATGTSPLKVTSTTVVTNLNSDLLDGLHETSFFRARGDQSIASSVPTTTELATSNNLCGSWNVKYTGASGHLVQFNAGSGSTRYMQFYSTYSGSLYWRNSTDSTLNTKSWKTIVDSANYTGIVLKIGTATKGSATLPIYLNAGTPTACSTTLGVSITGNAATASKLKLVSCYNGTTNNDLWSTIKTSNSSYIGTATVYEVYNDGGPTTYGEVLDIVSIHSNHWQPQLWFDSGKTGSIRHRNKDYNTTWGSWYVLLDNNNYAGTLDSRYVTLTTNQTVSGIKTFSTQQKFTVATGTSPFTVSSTTVVGNLNADMVDGYHSSKLFRSFGGVSIDFNFSDYNNNNGLYYLHSNYTQSNKNGITYGSLMNFSSSGSSWQIISGSDARLYYRNRWWSGGGGAWSAWKTIAYTSDIKNPANYYWANVRVSASSNSGTSPTFNTCYTSNWFRSTGSTGWYSESYGGGWYMADSTWIRTYGSKSVYQNTGQIRTDGYLVTNGGITVGATSPNNGTYKSHVTGNSWSSGYIRAGAGFYHNSVNSNSYVLLAGGSYKSLADFAKGNAGASNRGVYVTNGTVTAMTYYLNATVNSGASGKLAYYSGTNSIDDYTSTVGSSGTPIYLSSGVPTACTGVMVKYWASYTINSYNGTSVTYSKNGGNYNFVTSTSRRDTGRCTIGTVYPSGQTWYTTLVWAVGNASDSKNSSNSLLYCTLIRGYNSGSTYYWYVNTADDASTNDGSFGLFFLCF